ncbi:MAG: apolipoprotein N-acyltransferase [Candidatus Syntrophonatronum acetioxidans]|uniref:Apolipoprotein N-acyltransferase n=1 Tax=Candidatus Syntrophonatronum acetioxidans TaxID=1795816 RepID=A0A424YAY9_9FIRM|nr:MAG: apolipoprotein N-acyltransferase [Candidatus Syntrophonatronum acetioxidans]
MPKYIKYFLPLLTALLLVISFPRWDQGYLAWAALLPLFFFCYQEINWKESLGGGLLCGLVFFLFVSAYMVYSMDFFFPRYFGLLVVLAIALYSAFFFALFSLGLFFFLRQPSKLLLILGSSSLWVILEYVRSSGILGHTGGFLGYSQSIYPGVLQVTALYGYWGLPFLMVMFQGIIFLFLKERFKENQRGQEGNKKGDTREGLIKRKGQKKGFSWEPGVYLFLFFLLLGTGLFLPSTFPLEKREKPLKIALLQGNIPHHRIVKARYARDNFTHYLDFSKKAREKYGSLDLIVWPELVLSRNTARVYPRSYNLVAQKARELDTPLLIGSYYQEREKEQEFNSIFLQKPGDPFGKSQRYDKIRLVPFAEHLEIPEIVENFFDLKVALGTYTPGEEVKVFNMEGKLLGGVICFESYFPRPALDMIRRGAEHIFILTNNALFLDSNGLEQHARVAAVRAAETGVGFTQVANTGYTLSYNYRGEEVLSLPRRVEGIAFLETDFTRRNTLYRQWGDYFVYLCFLVLGTSGIYLYKNYEK